MLVQRRYPQADLRSAEWTLDGASLPQFWQEDAAVVPGPKRVTFDSIDFQEVEPRQQLLIYIFFKH